MDPLRVTTRVVLRFVNRVRRCSSIASFSVAESTTTTASFSLSFAIASSFKISTTRDPHPRTSVWPPSMTRLWLERGTIDDLVADAEVALPGVDERHTAAFCHTNKRRLRTREHARKRPQAPEGGQRACEIRRSTFFANFTKAPVERWHVP